jgi:hypothetical protein
MNTLPHIQKFVPLATIKQRMQQWFAASWTRKSLQPKRRQTECNEPGNECQDNNKTSGAQDDACNTDKQEASEPGDEEADQSSSVIFPL